MARHPFFVRALLLSCFIACSSLAAEREDGCLEGRTADYLQRHGLDGNVDPDQRLMFIREYVARGTSGLVSDSIIGSSWTSLGPSNGAGRATSIAFHPTTPGTVLVGAAGGGVWRTMNNGTTWTPLSDNIPDLSVGAVVYAPSDPSKVYVGTGEGARAFGIIPGIGLLYSSDGGVTWTLPSTVIASSFYRLSVNPTDPSDLVAATSSGLLRSTNGQDGPWVTTLPFASSGATLGYGPATDIVRDPSNTQILYATTYDNERWCARGTCSDPENYKSPRVVKSTNGGSTWVEVMNGLPASKTNVQVGRISIAIAASSPSTLYAAMNVTDWDIPFGAAQIYKTTDGGDNWSATNLTGGASFYFTSQGMSAFANALVVSPTDPDRVYAGGVHYISTTDGGSNWSEVFQIDNPSAAGYVHADCHELRYDATGTLWIADDGGVHSVAPDGTVTDRNNLLVTREFYALAQDPANRDRLLGGQQDNGTSRHRLPGGTWDSVFGGDGFDCPIDQEAPEIAFASAQFNDIVRTSALSDSTLTWIRKPVPSEPSEFIPFWTHLTLDPVNSSTVYAVTARLWKSTTAGDAWWPLPTVTNDASVWDAQVIQSMAIAPSNPQILMVGKLGLYHSSDGGATWALGTGLPAFRRINAIAIDPVNPAVAYAALAGSTLPTVWCTLDSGATWSGCASGMPSFSALSLRIDPTDAQTIYAGTEVGLYRSINGGATWSQFGFGLPNASVYDIAITRDGTSLRVATYGRGVWSLDVTSPTNQPPVVTASSSPAGAPLRVAIGTSVIFNGTFSDPDGDLLTGRWIFPDEYKSAPASSGAPILHVFRRAGRFPVTLSIRDARGGLGAQSVEVVVTEPSDDCATPVAIPGSGPFPYTVNFTTEGGTVQANDPTFLSSGCYTLNYTSSNWFSFAPASSGDYVFSFCGSTGTAELMLHTAPSPCGPYSAVTGSCHSLRLPIQNSYNFLCEGGQSQTVPLVAGTPYYIGVTNSGLREVGQQQLTIAPVSTPLVPVTLHVNPRVGKASGGQRVVITGSGFAAGATVTIGGAAATSVEVLTANLIAATTPAHAAGTVDVVVTSGATSTVKGAYTFTSVGPPPSIVAAAVTTTHATVTFPGVADADHYQIFRNAGAGYSLIDTIGATPSMSGTVLYDDNSVASNTSYLYRVRSVSEGNATGDSNADVVTTTLFTDDPLTAGSTLIKAIHLTQLRTAVSAMRTLASLSPATFTDPSSAGVFVKALHVNELRAGLDASRATLLLPPLVYMRTLTPGSTLIAPTDFMELRNGVK